MTSSLVGSEMCIRDRITGHVERRADCGTVSGDQQRTAGSRHDGGVFWRCLLYTSDAADDM
eukprot:10556054-Prorocentrum_lima.AAC.1